MSKININELLSYSKNDEHNKKRLYNKLLENSHKRIKHYAKNKKKECLYQVPEYTFGYPLYNYEEAVNYIANQLKDNGFIIKILHTYIHISWNFTNKNTGKNNKAYTDTNYKNIDDYNTIYNDTELLSLKDKTIKFLQI
jgi:hypothetical protein